MYRNLKKIYYYSKSIQYLLTLPKILFDFYRYRILSDKTFLKLRFKFELGYDLNLNNPKTFNEKLQWLKLYDRTELHTICANKFAVRAFIAKEIGDEFLIPLLYHSRKANLLGLNSLIHKPCIIKATHSCARNIIVKEPGKYNFKTAQKQVKKWLKENYYYRLREWQYKNIPPAIIIEELLQDKNGEIPLDFKFFCFNGQIEYIEVHENRHSDHKKLVYDKNWNVLDFISTRAKGSVIKEPVNFDLMKAIVYKLSSYFYFVRVDLYNINGKIYFSELTFHPGSGFRKFYPKEQDRILGDKLTIPLMRCSST